MLQRLDLYTHRVAIAHDRLLSVADGQVRFRSTRLTAGRWKDDAHGNRLKIMTLSADEFLRRSLDEARDRFLLHGLPGGRSTGLTACFVCIRHFGLLANRDRTAKLAQCRAVLAVPPPPPPIPPESVAALVPRLTGVDITECPVCRAGWLRVAAAPPEAPGTCAAPPPPPLRAARPRAAAGKALPLAPRFRYNPQSL